MPSLSASVPAPTLLLLSFAARLWGVPLDQRAVAEAVDSLAVSAAPDEHELEAQLRKAAPVAGFEVIPFSGSIERLLARTHPRAPAFRIVPSVDGGFRWIALLGQHTGKAMLSEVHGGAEPRELDPQETSKLLQNADDSLWFFLEPLRPLEGARSSGHHHPSPWSRLAALLQPERADLWVVVVYAVLVGLLSLAVPVAVQALVNTVAFGVLRQPVLVLTLLVLGGLVFAGVLRAAQVHVVEVLQRRLFVRAAVDTAGRMAQAQVAAFRGHSGPELVNRFFDVLTLQKSASILLLDGLGIVLQVAIGALLMGFYHPILLAFDVVLMGALLFVIFVLGRGGLSTSLAESQAKYAVVAWLEELAKPTTAFHSVGGRAFASLRVQHLCSDYIQARRDHFRVVMRQTIGMLALHAIASAALLGVGAILVMERQLTLGQLVAAELVVSAMLAGISKLGKYLETFYDLLTAADKLGYLIDVPLERASGDDLQGSGPLAVELREVSFVHEAESHEHHAGGHETHVFHDLSLRTEPGQSAGITGASGSGKSTLAELLLGYRTATKGSLLLDGTDLRELRLDDLRSRAAVAREADLFDGTIYENIRIGRPGVGTEEVRQALAFVGLLDTVHALPEALHHRISVSDGALSEGQRALIPLARAVAGQPRLLIVDGLLDGLEEGQQRTLLRRLTASGSPWTLLLLTRHPNLAALCGRAFSLKQGHLVGLDTAQGAPFHGEASR